MYDLFKPYVQPILSDMNKISWCSNDSKFILHILNTVHNYLQLSTDLFWLIIQ